MRRRVLVALAGLAALALMPGRAARTDRGAMPRVGPSAAVPPFAAPRDARPAPPLDAPGRLGRARTVLVNAAKTAKARDITDVAAALAYYAFLAVPSLLLVAVGMFGLVAGPGAVASLVEELEGVVPAEAATLLGESLTRITENAGSGLGLVGIGFLVALWSASGAMTSLMRALNRVYEHEETRGFVRQRVVALGMLGWALLALVLTFGLLVLGPPLSDLVGGVLNLEALVGVVWWTAQWPILIGGLLLAFAGLLVLGPNRPGARFRPLTPGAGVAVAIWLAASGLFALYVGTFGSYNKAWGALSAVIVMLTWLWLSSLAVLFGAQVDAELEGGSSR